MLATRRLSLGVEYPPPFRESMLEAPRISFLQYMIRCSRAQKAAPGRLFLPPHNWRVFSVIGGRRFDRSAALP